MDLTEPQYFELVIIMIGPGGLLLVIPPRICSFSLICGGFAKKQNN